MDQKAVEVIEPTFVKGTSVGFNDVLPVKSIDLSLRTFKDEITFSDLRCADNILLVSKKASIILIFASNSVQLLRLRPAGSPAA